MSPLARAQILYQKLAVQKLWNYWSEVCASKLNKEIT